LGGFAGSNNASITNCYAAGGFSSSAQSNNVQSILNNGGFCSAGNGSFTSCFWDTDLSGAASSTYGTGLATSLMQSQSTFTAAGWDFDDSDGSADWYMPAGGYPELQWQLVNPVDLEEFGILAQYWGDTGCVSGQDCFAADWYVDGTIDTLDLTQLTESWLSDGIMISGN
jgi:hypothetical protein